MMKTLIIGYKGAYGSWLTKRLQSHFGEDTVVGIDKDSNQRLKSLIPNFQIIINCSSMSASRHVVEQIAKLARPSSLIIDLTTSKKEVGPILSSVCADVAMIHPMSAPPESNEPLSLDVKVYVIIEKIKNQENKNWYVEFSNLFGGVQEAIPLTRHNQMEDIAQSVPHLLIVAYGEAVAVSGFTLDEIEQMATPVSRPLCQALRRHFQKGNPDTFAELQRLAYADQDSPRFSAMSLIKNIEWVVRIGRPDLLLEIWLSIKKKIGL